MNPNKFDQRRRAQIKERILRNREPKTHFYTDASSDQEKKTGTTAIVDPETEAAYHHKHAPSATSFKTLAIVQAISDHAAEEDIAIRTDSQKAVRNFRENILPSHIMVLLKDTIINHLNTTETTKWITGHQSIE